MLKYISCKSLSATCFALMQAILLCVAGCFGLYEMTKAMNNAPGAEPAMAAARGLDYSKWDKLEHSDEAEDDACG